VRSLPGACFELCDACFQRSELLLRAREKLALHVEVLAGHDVEAVEERDQQRVQILFEVLRR
jgi:hypothetical protein